MKQKKSKTILISSLFSFLFLVSFTMQAQVFEQGTKFINAGIGFGNRYTLTNSNAGLPLSASYEVGVTDKIGVGGFFGYSSSSDPNFNLSYSLIMFGARGAYHFEVSNDKLDLYGGLILGYYSWSGDTTISGTSSGLTLGLFGGAHYMFSEKFGGYAELGYTIAYLNLGVTFKL